VIIEVAGSSFVPGAVIEFGTRNRRTPQPTTYVGARHLRCSLDASWFAGREHYYVRVDNTPAQGGGDSNDLTFEVVDVLLRSLLPASVVVNSGTLQLTATGEGFGPTSQVRWNGISLATSFVNATTLTATVDASRFNSVRTYDVTVYRGASGNDTSNALPFAVVYPPPVIAAVTPASVIAGDRQVRSLSLSGSGFGSLSRVLWNGSYRSTNYDNRNGTLVATVNSVDIANAGTAQLRVENPQPGGGLSDGVTFTIHNPAPVIAATSPRSLVAGRSVDERLTITGGGFNTQTQFELDGVALAPEPYSLRADRVNLGVPRSLLVHARTAVLRVTNPTPGGGAATRPVGIENPLPMALALRPSAAVIGASTTDIYVDGANFTVQSVVRWGQDALPTELVHGSQLRVTVAAQRFAAAGYVPVTVVSPPPGGGVSDALNFMIGNPVPEIVSLNPSGAGTGSSTLTTTVSGAQFIQGCTVTWKKEGTTDPEEPLPVTYVNAGRLEVRIDAQRMWYGGRYLMRAHNPAPNFGPSNEVVLTVTNPVPQLAAVAPNQLQAGAGTTTITLSGTNFVRESKVYDLGGQEIASTWISTTAMRLVLSSARLATAGYISLRVVTPPPGGGISQYRQVTVFNPVPAITNLSPMLAVAGDGVTISIAGVGFNAQSRLLVTWPSNPNGVPFAPATVSPTFMRVAIPSGSFQFPLEVRLAVVNAPPGGGMTERRPFVFVRAPAPVVDLGPVTFSVNGPVDEHTAGLQWRRGHGPSTPYAERQPAAGTAGGMWTPQLGDVQDYFVNGHPSEAELFQSEPGGVALKPAGTNNQILVADRIGLVAGTPGAAQRDNINGVSFGEDYFGVAAVSPSGAGAGIPSLWQARQSSFAPNVVIADSGTSFRFSVNPYAKGLADSDVAMESLRRDEGYGAGPWLSHGHAAAEVFGTPALVLPDVPPVGTNRLVHHRMVLALGNRFSSNGSAEDNLDALECIGDNDPLSWGGVPGMLTGGNLHARCLELPPHALYLDGLGPPGEATHWIGPGTAPIFFTVDRRSTGKPRSAVRTQARLGEAAGDVFLLWADNNFLLIDEEEAGLYGGELGGARCDDMDALILNVHILDRSYLVQLVNGLGGSGLVTDHDPDGIPNSGDEYRTGPGYSYSLQRYFLELHRRVLRLRLGFSVTTDSIGLEGTPVDYEAGLDPSGYMQQAGDVYFTQFGDWGDGMGVINPAPASPIGTHYRWYEEVEIGLEPGTWAIGASSDFASLPDELNALDTSPSAPGCPGVSARYGAGCTGSGNYVPDLRVAGCPAADETVWFGVSGGLGGSPCFFVQGTQAVDLPFLPGCNLLVGLLPSVVTAVGNLSGSVAGAGSLSVPFRITPNLLGLELATQAVILDSGSTNGLITTTNGVMVKAQ
jgi:hypothetical protein